MILLYTTELRTPIISDTKDERSKLREDEVCAAIFKSAFFSADNGVELVDPVEEAATYSRFHPANKWHTFKRPYDLVNVSVLQTVQQEAVFPCLTRPKGVDELKLYLISHEYDFRGKRRCPPAHGRFVFEYDPSDELARLLAIAEEMPTNHPYELRDRAKTDLAAISSLYLHFFNPGVLRSSRAC